MLIPTTSEKNLRALLQRLNDCSFDQYGIRKLGTKWAIFAGTAIGESMTVRPITEQTITTREAIIALCVVLETMTSIRDKSFDDGYQSCKMDNETPGRGEG